MSPWRLPPTIDDVCLKEGADNEAGVFGSRKGERGGARDHEALGEGKLAVFAQRPSRPAHPHPSSHDRKALNRRELAFSLRVDQPIGLLPSARAVEAGDEQRPCAVPSSTRTARATNGEAEPRDRRLRSTMANCLENAAGASRAPGRGRPSTWPLHPGSRGARSLLEAAGHAEQLSAGSTSAMARGPRAGFAERG